MACLQRIVQALGGEVFDNGRRALIPGPGHSRKDRSVSLSLTQEGRVLIHCFAPQDDWREVRDYLRAKGLLGERAPGPAAEPSDPARAPPSVAQARDFRLGRARRLWREAKPIRQGDSAGRYFSARAIAAKPHAHALRLHGAMTSLEDAARRPALVAAIRNRAGALQGVQVTLLDPHAPAKAALDTPRRVIGRLLGGAVRLSRAAKTLLVAEGVETALSAAEALKLPAWALLSAYNLARFEPPALSRLVVAVDNDVPGRSAAQTLKARLGALVEVALPPHGCKDWNDWARLQAEERRA